MNGYSVWLTLEKDSRSSYRDLIIELSKRFKSPSFEPHCTIYGRLDVALDNIKPVISDIAKKGNQFSTTVKRLKSGKSKWKSLYLAINSNEEMNSLYGKCNKKFGSYRKYAFDPHLSIAYGLYDPESIHNATKNIIIPKYLAFSSIAIVKTGEKITEWETVYQRQFGEC